MKELLKINDQLIIREEDKMLFSASNMKIYKFNEKGFKLIKAIQEKGKVSYKDLSETFNKEFEDEELKNIVNKMIENKVLINCE